MGLLNAVRSQFADVIEFVDESNKLVVFKYGRKSGDNELKQGTKVIVRESQCAVFLKGGKLADVMHPGIYSLTTDNFPVLSSLKAFPSLFVSPVISDVYFVSTRQFVDNKWATKNPIMMRDKEFNMVRVRAFGKFAFRIVDATKFMTEIFGTKGIVLTYDIVEYLSSMVTETFSVVLGECQMTVLDLATEYRKLSTAIQQQLNESTEMIGIEFSDVIVENISLPDEVEKLIDEQSGIGMAKQDMESFMQYQTARAMRDASKQKGGLAGLGAGMAVGNTLAKNVKETISTGGAQQSKAEQLREIKALLDEGILTQEEQPKIRYCKNCNSQLPGNSTICPQCGANNKKPIYKRVWFIILCIIVVFAIIGAAAGDGDNPRADNSGNKPAEEEVIEYTGYDIANMNADLESNAAAAKDKYMDKYVEITGELSNIDSDGNYISLTDPDDEWDLVGIMCYIETDEQLDEVKELSTGDDVTVGGKVTNVGEIIGYSIDIDYIK